MTTLRAETAPGQYDGLRITRYALRLFPAALRPALLSLALNLPLALAGVHRGAYDTYVHIFFADHYRLNWFELREFRWYGGFSVASYPPLVHQVIALLSWPLSAVAAWFAPPAALPGVFRYRGEEAAYVVVLLAVLAALPYAVSAFARIFVGPRAARWAGLLAILSPAIGLAGWSFGQLPTLAGTVLLLFALAQGGRFVRHGQRPALIRSLALAGAAAAAHHAALMFGAFAGAVIIAHAGLQDFNAKTQRGKGAKEEKKSLRLSVFALREASRPLARGAAWALLAGLAVALALWPFLEWSAGYQPQAPIDHASRHSFLADPVVTFTFFWPAYGVFLLLIPWALWAAIRLPRLRPLGALAALFFALGLGGTTPLPRWLFGPNWEWLTYDRFALWAGICLLPFAGAFLARYRRLFTMSPPHRATRSRSRRRALLLVIGCWSLVIASALYGSLLSTVTRAQPRAVDLTPIAEFLAEGANDQWRYLTLGFGDQAARLAALTTAGTPDGAYHTARELDVLRQSGLAQLDGLVWQPAGAEGIRPFLEAAGGPDGWAVRWVFVNHPAYEPILRETGWRFDRALADGVELWRKDRVWPVAPWTLVKSGATPAARWWGAAPLAALAIATTLAALDDQRLRRTLRAARGLLFAGILLIFPIGWHEVVYVRPASDVFLAYRGVLVFASDSLLAALLLAWLAERWMFPEQAGPVRRGPPAVGLGWLGLLAATLISTPGSVDPWLSTALFLHLALLGGLYLYLQTERLDWNRIALLLTAQLCFQAGLAVLEFASQSTLLLARFHLPFLGALRPQVPGASVVQTSDGVRWLRAYGSLWHPNVLGAVLLLCLGGPILKALKRNGGTTEGNKGNEGTKSRISSLSPFISLSSLFLGVVCLALSFSRSAWVGAAVAAGVLLFRLPRAEWRRLGPAAALGAAALALVVVPFRALFFTRATADARSPLERHSVEDRTSVARVALTLAGQHPWTGVGAGAFVQALAADPAIRVTREPVHSVPLLVLAETGLPGALALGVLAVGIAWEIARRGRGRARRQAGQGLAPGQAYPGLAQGQPLREQARDLPLPQAHVFAALLAGLLVMALFDHFLWSSFPGRLLAVLALGFWAAAEGRGQRKEI